ncbi:heme-dependent oxidative N-demethylase family protein [Aspergillus nidulans FGSC A4]|uniref:Uncharacterized protein n=1 Tax=Emericella nidulans (strain FGSC A4 / ATCC 38163 / CBS 112.46 / NRRL 194 / M139) TaxID=227321 RepID=C8VJA2_EMENI|nr:hypothetical protein [Aspergillus nidulans FGSC A4]CBF83819.1 TPA: conserved hypothetical protein [Aspergillus nidulans FGSC A4]
MPTLDFVLARTPLVAFLTIFICFFVIYIRRKPNASRNHGVESPSPYPGKEAKQSRFGYPPVTPLPSFNWETTEPLVFRPFKPKFHLTMAITHLDLSDLIPMDKTYLSRLSLREKLLAEHPDVVRGVNIHTQNPTKNEKIREALCEWYAYVMGTYLPERYPTMFRLVDHLGTGNVKSEKMRKMMIESLVTGLKAPVDPEDLMRFCPTNIEDEDDTARTKTQLLYLLDTLGSWIDEDFLILLPSPVPPPSFEDHSSESDPELKSQYHLEAYTTYYPAGFDTRKKLSLSLSAIHAPLPGYKQKLSKSMDRFFERLEVGKAVVRVNWSIMPKGTGLFAAFGGLHNHSPNAERGNEKVEKLHPESFDGEDTFLRCERQTLHRLPNSKALLFAFHTYTYPLKDVKEEGLGEELAIAIDGLKEGSVPEIHEYKNGPYWGEAVKAFLRS